MAGVWSVGAATAPRPPAPPAARPAAPAPVPAGPQVVACPACGSTEVKVRTSKGAISYLICQTCNAEWKDPRRLVRVLVVEA